MGPLLQALLLLLGGEAALLQALLLLAWLLALALPCHECCACPQLLRLPRARLVAQCMMTRCAIRSQRSRSGWRHPQQATVCLLQIHTAASDWAMDVMAVDEMLLSDVPHALLVQVIPNGVICARLCIRLALRCLVACLLESLVGHLQLQSFRIHLTPLPAGSSL